MKIAFSGDSLIRLADVERKTPGKEQDSRFQDSPFTDVGFGGGKHYAFYV
jgi:hypothetical protein